MTAYNPLGLSNAALDDLVRTRRQLHQNPELLYELPYISNFVAEQLKQMGCDDVVEGMGQCGVVGIIHGRNQAGAHSNAQSKQPRMIGLRADMDALPINEQSDAAWVSQRPGMMHACGHDGHTTMLLGAARYLCEQRDFCGSVAVIFQPAEEGGAGAQAMIDDGLLKKFPLAEIYGMHNRPGLPVGAFAITPGAALAAVDEVDITITGVGGHAAFPQDTVDPLPIAASLVQAAQHLVARNVAPAHMAVLSLTSIHGGDAFNVIPTEIKIGGTVRTLSPDIQDLLERRLHELCAGLAQSFGCKIDLNYIRHYPILNNHAQHVQHAIKAVETIRGREHIDTDLTASLGGEDFAFMLNACPGAMIWIGNGPSAGLHHPAYDFNDDAIALGVSYWVQLTRDRLGS